jgi:hypothetical protein
MEHHVAHRKVIISVAKFQHIDKVTLNSWLESEHIHLLIQLMFHDSNHPIMNKFHVDIITSFRNLLIHELDSDQFGRALYGYCKKNYMQLNKHFIFYVENQGTHWVVYVYISPFAALHQFFKPKKEQEFAYRAMTYNPLSHANLPGRDCELIFLLNSLSN